MKVFKSESSVLIEDLDCLAVARIYYGERQVCKTEREAEGVAYMLREFLQLRIAGKTLKFSVVDEPQKFNWSEQPDLLNGIGCDKCDNVFHCRDKIGFCVKNPPKPTKDKVDDVFFDALSNELSKNIDYIMKRSDDLQKLVPYLLEHTRDDAKKAVKLAAEILDEIEKEVGIDQ